MFTLSDPLPSQSKFNIVLMVMGSLTGRMASRPILPVKLSITISTMLNFDGNCDGNRVRKCKQTLRKYVLVSVKQAHDAMMLIYVHYFVSLSTCGVGIAIYFP